MAGLCEGGNEPSGSLKAICKTWTIFEYKISQRVKSCLSVRTSSGSSPRKAKQNQAKLMGFHVTPFHNIRNLVCEAGNSTARWISVKNYVVSVKCVVSVKRVPVREAL
ncbi:hypothetical protein ANN_23832 [Periplaneta americana]|uniref:Uncharacterized protein n=1 Tax=Periplaneta americana TaxID=6978 RepID=A0ABQ8SM54_PERAM|nr:hypothetical protein ANN_23832 [Periplaneta americana]